jgi:threonine/homoserine/homoserine lactone efflux protein
MKSKLPSWAVMLAFTPRSLRQGIGCFVATMFAPVIFIVMIIAMDRLVHALLPVLSVAGALYLLYIIGKRLLGRR